VDCPETQALVKGTFTRTFSRKLEKRRIPISGSIALTNRCNLRCVHCYLGRQALSPRASQSKELSANRWMAIIDEIAAAGCLYLLFTGGEPLLRNDFKQIYAHTKQAGILTSVFTNGTRFTPTIIELFRDLPPHELEISLYGMCAATYQAITGNPEGHAECRRGIDQLHAAGIKFSLKTILMADNQHEFHAIKDLARQYNADFRFDAAIFPCLDGNQAPLAHRVSPEKAVDLELEDTAMIDRWRDYIKRHGDLMAFDKLYNCGTGLTSFHIDATGNLMPCVLVDAVTYNLSDGSFQTGWHEVIPMIREIRVDKEVECAQCDKRLLCGLCPAFFNLENGSAETKSEYLCAMGHHRFSTIFGLQPTGGHDAQR